MLSDSDTGEEFDIEHSETDSTCSALSSSSDNETDRSQNDISDDWTEIDIETDIPAPSTSFDFTANSQINEEISSFTKPSQFFNFFFNDELVENIVNQTNLYYDQTIRGRPSTSSANVENTWSTTISEMRIFFAVTMAMSIVQKPEEKLYWTRRPSIFTPFYAKLMSHQKFISIKKYLHFANNAAYDSSIHPQPKLNKIWPVYVHLNRKFQESYTPQQHITIDESLMLYKGRLGWVQYIPMKRARFGIKSYFLCESKSGYIWSSLLYTGKGTIIGEQQYANLPMSTQVVMALMKPLLNKGYCLTIDNFYSSVELADLLVLHTSDTYGTMKSNRKGNPKNLTVPKKVRPEFLSEPIPSTEKKSAPTKRCVVCCSK